MIEEQKKLYIEYRTKLNALDYAMSIISWDSETEAPVGCFEVRGQQLGVLSNMSYDLVFKQEHIDNVNYLYEHKEELDPYLKREIELVKKSLDSTLKIPQALLVEKSIIDATSGPTWEQAKRSNNFSLFAPCLEKEVDITRKFMKYLETDTLKGYDALLDQYEEGMTREKYNAFFALLKKELVPLIKEIAQKGYHHDDSFNSLKYSITGQKEFADYIMDVMCFDRNHGLAKESEHPFTSGTGQEDVRVTNHYYENNFTSSIFSAIHELGHATFDQQVNKAFAGTELDSCNAMGLHESQSRFYENIIGRSKEFWLVHFPRLQEIFPEQLKNVTVDDFYYFINKAECTLIRTEADELTYPLHIMIRYDLEQQLMNGEIEVIDLPKKWNEAYKNYLGLDVPSDTQGVLQDVHWSDGSFGYFPTYALGSAYAAQIYHKMKEEIDIDKILASGNLKGINEWLKDKVHQYGNYKKPLDILLEATGEDFNPKYYIDYLTNKYRKLYNL